MNVMCDDLAERIEALIAENAKIKDKLRLVQLALDACHVEQDRLCAVIGRHARATKASQP